MALRIAPWLVRLGALLGIASFFIPQFRQPGKPDGISPFSFWIEQMARLETDVLMINAAFDISPIGGCLLCLGTWPARRRESRVFRWILDLYLFLWSVLLATVGSIMATVDFSADATASTLLLFLTPLVLMALVIARILGGQRSTAAGGFFTACAGLLVLMKSLHWLTSSNFERTAGAFVPVAAGGLIAVGAFLALARFKPEAAVAVPEQA